MPSQRPPVRIRFKYNIDTGEIEEFIIDDNAASASEVYHDQVAKALASRLARRPDIADAGPVRLHRRPVGEIEIPDRQSGNEKKRNEE